MLGAQAIGALALGQGPHVPVAVAAAVAAGMYGGEVRKKKKKKRIIPLYEDPETDAGNGTHRPTASQAGGEASPPSSPLADPIELRLLKTVDYRPLKRDAFIDTTDWTAIGRKLEALAADRLEAERLEAERLATEERERITAERWLMSAVSDMAKWYVDTDENRPKAEAIFEEFQKARRKREVDEERFLILAAMELLR